jgi:RNA polymerase sigma-70 factor (ECF subfamily)
MVTQPETVTLILDRWRAGDRTAGDEIMRRLHTELRRLAGHYFHSERHGHTLQPTALVSELYLRLNAKETIAWRDRAHFLAFAAQTLRSILIDYARSRTAKRRGGSMIRVPLDFDRPAKARPIEEFLALNEALDVLAALDARAASVVEMRFFAGLEEREVAEALGVSEATVKRDWKFARAWLLARLRRNP